MYQSHTSSPSKSRSRSKSESAASAHPQPQISWTRNAIRQLKLIVPGAAITYHMDTIGKLMVILWRGNESFQSKVALVAFGSFVMMITLFLYILFLIYRRDEQPHWRTWRESGSLSTIIPVLTTTIIVGWILHVIVLGTWSDLGYIQGLVGASGLYALIFGVLALIHTPRKHKGT